MVQLIRSRIRTAERCLAKAKYESTRERLKGRLQELNMILKILERKRIIENGRQQQRVFSGGCGDEETSKVVFSNSRSR